jgi:hypothetical protein
LGAKNITKLGSTALAAGDIVSGRVYQIEYDGTRFQLLNPSASSVASFSAGSTGFTPSSATTGAVTLAGTLATTNGGTGLTSFTANGVVYASSSSALATGSALTFDGATLGISRAAASDSTLAIGNTVDVYTANYGKQGSSAYGATSSGDAFVYTSTKSISIMADGASSVIKFSAGGNSEQMRLNSTGLGIGTSSPAYKLDVSGAIQSSVASGNGSLYVNNSSLSGKFWTFIPSTSSGETDLLWYYGGTGAGTKLTLTNSGNLGLGVTPSAWTVYKVLQMNRGSFVSSGTNAFVGSNWFYDGEDKYITSDYASFYRQSSGAHTWATAPSGTAGNAITFTQAMTLDASGRLGIGTTSPTYPLTVQANSSTQGFRLIGRASDNIANMSFVANDGSTEYAFINTGATYLALGVNSAERARIDSSGNLLVGYTTATGVPTQGVGLNTGVNSSISLGHNGSASGATFVYFGYNGGLIGSITQSGTTAVLYNLTSDQRLKENIQDAESSSNLIDSIQVRKFDWKTDQTHQRYGFIAQELVTVYPEAVHQPADAEEMMAVDYSKLVPMLVKEIQSLRLRVLQLESK